MSYKFKALAIVAVVCCAVIGVLMYAGASRADKFDYWVTVDSAELTHIQNTLAADETQLKSVDVRVVRDGIAVVRLNEPQMEALSSSMHDKFHKCSGYIAHPTEDAAIESINELARVDAAQQLVTYTIDNQAAVTPMLVEANELQNRQVILDLSAFPNRRYNQPSGMDSANWIKNKWTTLAAGRSDVTVEFYAHPTATSPQPSIILTINGTTLPDEIVVLGAHQDSINTGGSTLAAPGADDDASGIACLTETIRVLMAKNFRPNRTVKFMAYAAEEVGLRGSNAIAAEYRTLNKNVIGVMQLDMTNYKGTLGNDIVIFTDYTNAAQNQFVRDLITAYMPTMVVGTSSCGYGCSDHAAWHNKSYPASFPFESTFSDDNTAIHSANDTISRSNNNATHALKFTKLALSYVGELAKGSLAVTRRSPADFDGDGKTDMSVFRPGQNEWWYQRSSNGGNGAAQFGAAGDTITPGDFTGDGKTDMAFFRPSTGFWYVLRSEDMSFFAFPFGSSGDVTVPADYDGDGKADAAVFRASNSTWYISRSTGGTTIAQFGANGDVPLTSDFDGDGKTDIGIYRPASSEWWISKSTGGLIAYQFGQSGDKAVCGDHTGDGKADIAFFRPSSGTWFVLRSEDSSYYSFPFGTATDLPVPGDYDGDGKTDAAIFRPSSSTWYAQRSTAGSLIQQFGQTGDLPVPNAFVR
ncbi:MAG: M20/M25/M40 family metallo-hydrolase [Pyrinomonadaceae bacterium]|nr:M20/M25/M40 family metallo-hydrolase [Pyrinomonadaceae bacterium]MBP6211407.1 M20/M25/M40 family metallo-hydrolase [Pyrinomonadaceae bacterium]